MATAVALQRPRPFLKWAGGKSQLLPELVRRSPAHFATYHEPFLGGGALFFELHALGRVREAVLSDVNPHLVDAYLAVRDHAREVIRLLRQHPHEQSHYYDVRAQDPASLTLAERAARIIYLNKTCYNGLYRENRRGQFNVPFGRYTKPTICDEPNLLAVSRALQDVEIVRSHFSSVLERARRSDFVYFDPPYDPVSKTASFTSYASSGFTRADQEWLSTVFAQLASSGVWVMLSNSDTALTRSLYGPFRPDRVLASRSVNCNGAARGRVSELIVCSYAKSQMHELSLLERPAPLGRARRPRPARVSQVRRASRSSRSR
jgi:DNA adenine methylase